jgi:peptidoglycan/xylan/chitin deacetylase (PgdA/CDA1 family)
VGARRRDRPLEDEALVHTLAARVALRAAVPARAMLGSRTCGEVGILMYHRITERCPGVSIPTWNVTPERFRRQLRGLLARGFQAWPLLTVVHHGRQGLPVPRRTFVVTFDDGYENVYRNAWAVLRELRVPATIFLATSFLGGRTPFPFDDWPDAGSSRVPPHAWRPLTIAQCREMAADGLITLGAHTHTHADFRTRPDALEEDLSRCVRFMREQFGVASPAFAFPYGTTHLGFAGPVLAAAAQRTGVPCGLTSDPELVDPASDPFEWGRFAVSQRDSAATLAAYLDGWYGLARRARHWLRWPWRPPTAQGMLEAMERRR